METAMGLIWLVGLLACLIGGAGVIALLTAWATDQIFRTFNMEKEFLSWYAEKLRRKKGSKG